MKKILVGHINAECNEFIRHRVGLDEFQLFFGEDCLNELQVRDIFENAGCTLIPTIYARIQPTGMIKHEAAMFIANKVIKGVREHKDEISGIYLHLHGASCVEGLEGHSLENYVINEIRKIVGNEVVIAVVMDPHGNITSELSDKVNIVRCYRESPHLDSLETHRLVASKLVELLENPRELKPIIRKLPMIVEGEKSVSAHEPVLSINKMLDEFEKDDRVFSASFHVGYLRQDHDKLGMAIIVIPSFIENIDYCSEVADKMAEFIWESRDNFQFTSDTGSASESVSKAIKFELGNVVITDSGDNCGAGAPGYNTILLKEILSRDLKGKRVLVAGIHDKQAHLNLSTKSIGDSVEFNLGVNEDKNSESVLIKGTLSSIGMGVYGSVSLHTVGQAYVVRVGKVDIVVLNSNVQYGSMRQFEAVGLNFHDYDIVVVKMGYLDTGLIPETDYHIMALTPGATDQRIGEIEYKHIRRPMWPLD